MNRIDRLVGSFAVTLLVACTVACSDTPAASTPRQTVSSITLVPADSSLAVREEITLSVDLRDGSGRQMTDGSGVTWASSDASTVTVDQTGVLKGIKLGGPVTITASKDGVSGHAAIIVKPILQFDPAANSVPIDSTRTLGVKIVDFYGVTIGTPVATWTSNNPTIVRVDNLGRITGVSAGTAIITATANGVAHSLSVEVGIASPYDGDWSAYVPNSAMRADIIVLFGELRSFDMQLLFGEGTPAVCTAPFAASGHFPLTGNQFSISTPYSTTTTGQFPDARTLIVSVPGFAVARSAMTCPPNVSVTGGGSQPPITLTIRR